MDTSNMNQYTFHHPPRVFVHRSAGFQGPINRRKMKEKVERDHSRFLKFVKLTSIRTPKLPGPWPVWKDFKSMLAEILRKCKNPEIRVPT